MINAGGLNSIPFDDTLWGTRIPDDEFLLLKPLAKLVNTMHTPYFQKMVVLASREIAPDNVYVTAPETNKDNSTGVLYYSGA